MRARKWGRIVNISSGAARGAGAIGPHYNASKTDMMQGRTDLARNSPLGRMGQADEVAQAVAMVLGNSYMTGQTIMLNGGMTFI